MFDTVGEVNHNLMEILLKKLVKVQVMSVRVSAVMRGLMGGGLIYAIH